MVRLLSLFLLTSFIWPQVLFAEPTLHSELRKAEVELGKPLTLKIYADDLAENLTQINLGPLNDLYAVVLHDNSIDGSRQTLTLKLYPRRTGKLLIPPLKFMKWQTLPHEVEVYDAMSRGTPLQLKVSTSSTSVWQREAVLVQLQLNTPDRYATVELDKRSIAGFEVTPLPVKTDWQETPDGGMLTLRAGWSLMPLVSGTHRIELPPVKYRLSGVTRRNFHLPRLAVEVRELPPYLPPTIPVGKVRIDSSISPDTTLKTGELAYWRIVIQSDSLTPYWLPPILRQLQSSDTVQFLPAMSTRSLQPDLQGVHGQVEHLIPFKPLKNGKLMLPVLETQYFDPDTGRLERIIHTTPAVWSLSWVVRLLISLTMLAILLILSVAVYRYWQRMHRYRTQRNIALTIIEEAEHAREILHGLRQAGKAEGWPVNLSLTDWARRWQDKYTTDMGFYTLIKQLSGSCYSNNSGQELRKLSSTVVAILRRPRKLHRKTVRKKATTDIWQMPYSPGLQTATLDWNIL